MKKKYAIVIPNQFSEEMGTLGSRIVDGMKVIAENYKTNKEAVADLEKIAEEYEYHHGKMERPKMMFVLPYYELKK